MITSDAGKALIQVRVSSEIPLLSLGEGFVEKTAAAEDRVFAERLESSKGGVDSQIFSMNHRG